jgi:hypothetical protein
MNPDLAPIPEDEQGEQGAPAVPPIAPAPVMIDQETLTASLTAAFIASRRADAAAAASAAAPAAADAAPVTPIYGPAVPGQNLDNVAVANQGLLVYSHHNRVGVTDQEVHDKIARKICKGISPGYKLMDIGMVLENDQGSQAILPVQQFSELNHALSNSLQETDSLELFYITHWDADGAMIVPCRNMILDYVPDLTAQAIIDNVNHIIEHANGDDMAQTFYNDAAFTYQKVLNSCEEESLCALVMADMSGHPVNHRSGLLALFYLHKHIFSLACAQDDALKSALYKIKLSQIPGVNVPQFVRLWRIIGDILRARGDHMVEAAEHFLRQLQRVEHKEFHWEVMAFATQTPAPDLACWMPHAITLYNKNKLTWITSNKTPSVFNTTVTAPTTMVNASPVCPHGVPPGSRLPRRCTTSSLTGSSDWCMHYTRRCR